MPSHLMHFLLMLRVDRVRVGSRAYLPMLDCPLCDLDLETLEHFIFCCPSPSSVKLRAQLISCLNDVDDIMWFYPQLKPVLETLRSPPTCTANIHEAQLRMLLGNLEKSPSGEVSKNLKKDMHASFKSMVQRIKVAWRHRCREKIKEANKKACM